MNTMATKFAYDKPRWPDGRQASYRNDPLALMLYTASFVSLGTAIWVAWFGPVAVWTTSAAASILLHLAAHQQLRRAVRRHQETGTTEPPHRDALSSVLARVLSLGVRRCERKAQKLEARAAEGRVNYRNHRTADFLRWQAQRERDWAQECQDLADQVGSGATS